MSASVRRIAGLVAALALSAVVWVGCGDDGNGNPGGSNNGGSGGNGLDASLVGDWLVNDRDNYKSVFSLKSTGHFEEVSFMKVTNFWINATWDGNGRARWRMENGKILLYAVNNPDVVQQMWSYSVTGNRLTLTVANCDGEYIDGEWIETDVCEEYSETVSKINLASFRNSLGTVRTQDPALRGDWRMAGGEELELYGSFYESTRRYISYDYSAYYTNGNHLFLLDVNCDEYVTVEYEWGEEKECVSYSIAETVELTYAITTVDGIKTLTLTNPSRGINDVWIERRYDDYYSQSKSKSIHSPKPRPTSPFGALPRAAR